MRSVLLATIVAVGLVGEGIMADELVRTGRTQLNVNRDRTFVTTMPSGYTRIRFEADIPSADMVNPAMGVTFLAEYSVDGGVTWVRWGGFTFRGDPLLAPVVGDPVNGHPWIEVPVPPAGSDVRLTVTNTGDRIGFGYIVQAWPE